MARKIQVAAALCCLVALGSCDKEETKLPGYQAGYEAGEEAGRQAQRSEMCSNIQNFSDSIHTALQNEGICS